MKTSVILPENDGVDHLNIYSRGATHLGRVLSNFSHTPFTHPQYGHFESLEGFWYWLRSGMRHEVLKELWGFEAKREGRLYEKVICDNFQEEIKKAIQLKIEQTPYLKERFIKSNLPFKHYYNYGGKVVEPKDSQFIIEFLDELRILWRTERGLHNGNCNSNS